MIAGVLLSVAAVSAHPDAASGTAEPVSVTRAASPSAPTGTAHKVAYLTFDDGPSAKITPPILSILARNAVHATFFVVGQAALKHPDLMRRIAAEGHRIGNHSFDHSKSIYRSKEAFLASVRACDEAIQKTCGVRTRLLRPPYWPTKLLRPAARMAACQAGYVICGYDIAVPDTYAAHLDPKILIDNVVSHTSDGKRKRAVILMHDATGKDTTADALPDVIEFLRRRGYEFRVLSEEEMATLPGLE